MDFENHGILSLRVESGWFHYPALNFHGVVRGGPSHSLNPRHVTLAHEVVIEIG